MLTFDTYARMREYSAVDFFGLGEFARFKNAGYPKYGFAIWLKCAENIAIQGGPLFLYTASGVADGTVLYLDIDKSAVEQGFSGVIGPSAVNAAVDLSATGYNPGYLWVQTFGLSSASMKFSGDVIVGDRIYPSETDGTWAAWGNSYTESVVNIDLTATTYVYDTPDFGFALLADVTSTCVVTAGMAMIQSKWCAGAGL